MSSLKPTLTSLSSLEEWCSSSHWMSVLISASRTSYDENTSSGSRITIANWRRRVALSERLSARLHSGYTMLGWSCHPQFLKYYLSNNTDGTGDNAVFAYSDNTSSDDEWSGMPVFISCYFAAAVMINKSLWATTFWLLYPLALLHVIILIYFSLFCREKSVPPHVMFEVASFTCKFGTRTALHVEWNPSSNTSR